ncbi:MAG: hypothetical protein MJ237_01170 [bacterium]|nr:hypothetical protein [bacterium]
MNIQKISAQDGNLPQTSFKASFVTLAEQNLGYEIKANVVDTFNREVIPQLNTVKENAITKILQHCDKGAILQKTEDFENNVKFFTLAAGAGSRFKKLANLVGNNCNKVSLPFIIDGQKTNNGEPAKLHMLDFALAMGNVFTGKEGVNSIVANKPSGSLGDIVNHYLNGGEIKDTIVCCGDNVFDDSAVDLMTFFASEINNPNKHLALIGVPRKTEDVIGRFGCLDADGKLDDYSLKLKGFVEKPKTNEEIEHAKQIAKKGKNIANTGMFYISKDAMTKLIDEIKSGNNPIMKNESEPYDFANACIYIHKMIPEWFGIGSEEGADVKLVNLWEDVGEPSAFFDYAREIKNGTFLKNFPKDYANNIIEAFKNRVHIGGTTPKDFRAINFSNDINAINGIKQLHAPKCEGVSIIA